MYWIKRKSTLLILILCIASVKIYAQNGKISGNIIDAENNESIPYASTQLIDKKTKKVVKFVQTDLEGNFNITNINNGEYTFKASYIGYQTMVRESVIISNSLKNIALGTIKMKTGKGNILNEVTVIGKKQAMQLGIDKKIFSVDQSIVSEGGSATDILQNVPSVQTDMDGKVSLRGSTGVKVLIDGKPSLIAGGDVAQILESIPASSIETVEVITNPSAKYDAEGQSGIINIVLKKNHKLGFNGNVALTAGNYNNYNGSGNLSFQNKKVNVFGNYSYRDGNRPGGSYNNISYLTPINNTSFATQDSETKRLFKGHNVKIGLDYYLTEKSIISLAGGLNTRNGGGNEYLNLGQFDINTNPLLLSNRTNFGDRGGDSYDLNLDFSHKFNKKGQELAFSTSWSDGNNRNNQILNTVIIGQANQIQNTKRGGGNNNFIAQLDFTNPVGKSGKFEAGYRSQIGNANSNTLSDTLNTSSGIYEFYNDISNNFDSKDQVHALYVNYQNQLENFGYQIGLRGEEASLDTRMGAYDINKSLTYTPGKIAYTRLYPSVFLTQKFKGEQQLQLSYSRRVNRPSRWDTNPFIDTTDPFNHRKGNPNLKPEDVHAYELSYSKFFKKFSLISTVYMRKTNDLIQRLRSDPDANGVTVSMSQNLTSSINSGLELIGKFSLVKNWSFTANTNLYQRHLNGAPSYGIMSSDGFSYNANLTNDFSLPANISLQLRADYQSKEVMAQGTRKANYGIDAGAKMDFYNKTASLSFNIRDIFDTRKWMMQTAGNSSVADFAWFMKGPMASVTLSYRFGKNTFSFKKKEKNRQESQRNDEEMF